MLDLILPALKLTLDSAAPRWMIRRYGSITMEEGEMEETGVWLKSLEEALRGYPTAPKAWEWTPPPASAEDSRLKTTVSALLRLERGEAAYAPPVQWPLFLEEGRSGLGLRDLSGAARGAAFHVAMRGLNLPELRGLGGIALRKAVAGQLDALVAAERLRESERQALQEEEIAAFFEGELGRRMLACEVVRREWAFNLRVGEGTGTRLVQGVIDCCFREPPSDGWVLVDYKTDADPDPEAVLERYAPQIALYARALTCITGRPILLAALYLTKKGKYYPYAPDSLALTGES